MRGPSGGARAGTALPRARRARTAVATGATRGATSPSPAASPHARMKRLCEESSSDTESDGTIDVGREEEYR